MRNILGTMALALFWSHATVALACSATGTLYWTIDAIVLGSDSSAFARNGAILVRLTLAAVTGGRDTFEPKVKVIQMSDGREADGSLNIGADHLTMTWVPKSPLMAATEYRVDVSTTSNPLPEIPGPTSLSMMFKTSNELAPELSLSGELSVRLRRGTAPAEYCNPCGASGCAGTREHPAVYADVELPVVTKGFESYGYEAWLWLSDRQPRTFHGPGEGVRAGEEMVSLGTHLTLLPGERRTIAVEIPDERMPWDGCFAFNVWDPVGNWKSAAALCLSADALAAVTADAGMTMTADALAIDAAADSATAADSSPSVPAAQMVKSCSAAGGGGRAHPTAVLVLGLVLCAVYVGRRRSVAQPHRS
jgi:hypothetical protein